MNNALLIGRLTRDAEVSDINDGGRKVIRFTLAVNRNYRNAKGEQETDFIPVVYFTNHGDKLIGHLTKGKLLSVKGKISVRTVDGEDGTRRRFTNIEAENLEFVGSSQKSAV